MPQPVDRGPGGLSQCRAGNVKLVDAIAAVEARQCTYDDARSTWVNHRIASGGCDTCDRGLWTLLDIYAIPVGGY